MTSGQRVLVVDGLTETEEVLKAVLEPRGLHVERVRGNRGGLACAGPAPPSVLVLHEDRSAQHHARPDRWQAVPRVIIGAAEWGGPEDTPRNGTPCQYLAEPFHYRELIQAIEELLDPE